MITLKGGESAFNRFFNNNFYRILPSLNSGDIDDTTANRQTDIFIIVSLPKNVSPNFSVFPDDQNF